MAENEKIKSGTFTAAADQDADIAQFHKDVDAWVEKMNSYKGQVTHPRVGTSPVDWTCNIHAAQINEYITTDNIRHYTEATGDRNPLWNDAEYAAKSPWGGIIAPQTITDTIAVSWPSRRGNTQELNFNFAALPAGTTREFYEVIRPGDKFTVEDEFISLTEKKSQQKGEVRFFIEDTRRSYINQNGVVVAKLHCRMVDLLTPFKGAREEPTFNGGARKRHRFTDEERDAILAGYDNETRRGANTRKFDEVNVGDEVGPLVVGPVSTWDTAAWLSALPGYCTAFDVCWDILKSNWKEVMYDPDWNSYKCGGEGHLVDGVGPAAFSGGHAFAYGSQVEGLFDRLLWNWMGDGGFVKKLDSQFRSIPILGDAYHIHGTVTGKRVENGENLVDIELVCENQDGHKLIPSKATVRLP